MCVFLQVNHLTHDLSVDVVLKENVTLECSLDAYKGGHICAFFFSPVHNVPYQTLSGECMPCIKEQYIIYKLEQIKYKMCKTFIRNYDFLRGKLYLYIVHVSSKQLSHTSLHKLLSFVNFLKPLTNIL